MLIEAVAWDSVSAGIAFADYSIAPVGAALWGRRLPAIAPLGIDRLSPSESARIIAGEAALPVRALIDRVQLAAITAGGSGLSLGRKVCRDSPSFGQSYCLLKCDWERFVWERFAAGQLFFQALIIDLFGTCNRWAH